MDTRSLLSTDSLVTSDILTHLFLHTNFLSMLTTCLWSPDNKALEMAEFYTSIFPNFAYHHDWTLWWSKSASSWIKKRWCYDRRVYPFWRRQVRDTQWWTIFPTLVRCLMDDPLCEPGRARLLLHKALSQSWCWDVWMGRGSVRSIMATHSRELHWVYEEWHTWREIKTHEGNYGDEETELGWDRKCL